MNDYQEYSSYGSYLSRVLAIIAAFLVLVLAIWFVVRLASDDDTATVNTDTETVAAVDESVNTSDDVEGAINSGIDAVTIDESAQGVTIDDLAASGIDTAAGAEGGVEAGGQVLATNTEQTLPNTGPESILVFLAIPGVSFAAVKYFESKKRLNSSYLAQ